MIALAIRAGRWYEVILKDIIAFGGGMGLVLAVLLIWLSIRDARRLHDYGFLWYAVTCLESSSHWNPSCA